MTSSVVNVKKQVEELKQRILPKPDRRLELLFHYAFNRHHLHGKHGFQICVFNYRTGKIEDYKAVPEDEELRLMRSFYDEKIPKHAKRKHGDRANWTTFEDYIASKRCKCGYHKGR